MGKRLSNLFLDALDFLATDDQGITEHEMLVVNGEEITKNAFSCCAVVDAVTYYHTSWTYETGRVMKRCKKIHQHDFNDAVELILDFMFNFSGTGCRPTGSLDLFNGEMTPLTQSQRALWLCWLSHLAGEGEIERLMGDAYPEVVRKWEAA